MLSIDFIRNNKEKVILASENKNRQVDLDQIIALDDQKTREMVMEISQFFTKIIVTPPENKF